MKLADYLDWNRETYSAFGRRIGQGPDAVRYYALRLRIPRPKVMTRIWVESRGLVAPNDFYDLPELALEIPAPAARRGVSPLEQPAAAGARAPAAGFVGGDAA